MAFGFITFTVLWAVSCIALYFHMLRKMNEAIRIYEDAAEKYAEACQANEKAALRLKQLNESMMCPN